jgi:predicted dehydrogenase
VKKPELRIGFIGPGIIANRHIGSLIGSENVQVVAVGELDEVLAEAGR